MNPALIKKKCYLGLKDSLGFRDSSAKVCKLVLENAEKGYADKGFADCTKKADQIRYCYEQMKKQNSLPPKDWVKIEKSTEEALKAREDGNKYFLNNQLIDAIKCYNESLCLAPPGSETMAIGYANRSAIYLNAGYLQFCMDNIELALQNAYPERLKPKLMERKEECQSLMTTLKDSFEVNNEKTAIELSYPANPNNPAAIDDLELRVNKKFGRHIVAKRDLKPGDCVIIEEPSVKFIKHSSIHSNCFHCLKNNFYNLMPCPKSCSVMFCSEKCKDEAWNDYYKYQYPIIDVLLGMNIETLGATRICLEALSLFENIQDLEKCIESVSSTNNAFNLTPSKMSSFRSLCSFIRKDFLPKLDQRYIESHFLAILWYFFQENTDLKSLLKTTKDEDVFLNLLYKISRVVTENGIPFANTLEAAENPVEEDYDPFAEYDPFMPTFNRCYDLAEHGCTFLPSRSLLNHSCAPNTETIILNEKVCVFISRPIKAGQQLFVNYGELYWNNPLQVRQKILMDKFSFKCKCEACEDDWPQLKYLEFNGSTPYKVFTQIKEFMEENFYDYKAQEKADEYLKLYHQIIDSVCRKIPNTDHIHYQNLFRECMLVKYYKKPMVRLLNSKI